MTTNRGWKGTLAKVLLCFIVVWLAGSLLIPRLQLGSAAGLILRAQQRTSPPARGAKINDRRPSPPHPPSTEVDVTADASADGGRIFPVLASVRDAVIEYVFGPANLSGGWRPGRRNRGRGQRRSGGKEASSSPQQPQPSHYRRTERELRRMAARYAQDVVLRFNVTTAEEEAALALAAETRFVDVWAVGKGFVDVRFGRRHDVGALIRELPESLHTAHSVLLADVAAAVYQSYPSMENNIAASSVVGGRWQLDPADGSSTKQTRDGVDNVFFKDYQPLPVICQWMRLLEAMFPSLVEMISIGISYEGRDIPALKVGHPSDDQQGPRKTVVITGGLHAREWISTAVVNYVAWSFITAYGREPLITKVLGSFDFVFIPAVNPDGYEYTWQVDRLWRKSRQNTKLYLCPGFDLDHAFGYEWDGLNFQSDPCSESYGGDKPFQAVEASQLAQWTKNETNSNVDFVGLIDLHSYSQQILYPYAYTCSEDPPNLENLEELAAGLAKAIRLTSGEAYSIASACEGVAGGPPPLDGGSGAPRLNSGGGSALDWFYHELRARFTYQIKLRDTGSYGFLLPSEHIVPTGDEIFSAMKYFADYLLGNRGIEKLRREKALNALEEATVEEDRGMELRRGRRR